MRFWFLLIIVAILFSACVPNRKYVYMQKDDVNKKNLPEDSVVRSYSLPDFDYRVQPNDALFIRFASITAEEFDFLSTIDDRTGGGGTGSNAFVVNSELVNEHGEIRFPEIGNVKVAGMTVFQIQDTLQALADQYLESPVVRVRLVNFRFTVLGEVMVEGTHTTLNNRVTLPEALGLAGGVGELADRSNIKIIRQKDGVAQIAYVDLLDENLINSPYYYINQGDIFIVPALKQRPFRKYFGPNLALFVSSISVLLLTINLIK